MEGQQEGEQERLLQELAKISPEGHHPGAAYSLDAKVLTLRCVLLLEQGDKDHRPLGSSKALVRASSLLGVSASSMNTWMKELRGGVLGEEVKRGRPFCPHHTEVLSARQVGRLRLWILERAGRQKGKPNLKLKDVVQYVAGAYKVRMSKSAMEKLMKEMGFSWGKGLKKGIIMSVHEREDVVAYRFQFLKQIQDAERDDKVMVFGDGANVYIKEGEPYCWHLTGEVMYPLHESEGENLAIHSWATKYGLLVGGTDLWDVKIEGANAHERFISQCKTVLEAFSTQYPGKQGLFIYDNAGYAKKKEFVVSGKRKSELIDWAEQNHISASGTVDVLKKRIQDSNKYYEQQSIAQQFFSSFGHQLLYLPSCHPEYNLMELIWAKVKRYCIQHCDYTKAGAWQGIQEGMRMVSADDCERMARHCQDKMMFHWSMFKKGKWGSRTRKKRKVDDEEIK